MAKTGVILKSFPYAADGVNISKLAIGQIISFPDTFYDGLEKEGFVAASYDEPENSVEEAKERDGTDDEVDRRLMIASDQELKDIIARSGTPVSGNLVHALLVEAAKAQIAREAAGRKPVLGVDPNSGVTEQPLAAPGAPTPPSAGATVVDQISSGAIAADHFGGDGELKTDGDLIVDGALQGRDLVASDNGGADLGLVGHAGEIGEAGENAADADAGNLGAATEAPAPTNQLGDPLPERRGRAKKPS